MQLCDIKNKRIIQLMHQVQKGYNLTIKANNIFIGYDDIGESDVPIIFIHGFPLNKSSWDKQLEFFKMSHRVIAINVRSFGNSTRDNEILSMDLFADDLIAFMDVLKIKRTIICGLSMGGYIALNALDRYSNRFLGLVLCATQSFADSEEMKKLRQIKIQQIKSEGIDEFTFEFLENIFHPNTIENKKDIINKIEVIIRSNSSQVIINGIVSILNRKSTCDTLNNIHIPTLIICGKGDLLTPVNASQFLHEKIKYSSLEIIELAGHMSNLEQADEFNAILEKFLIANPLFLWDLEDGGKEDCSSPLK